MQSSSTADLVFSVPAVSSRLSELMTLEPGDIGSTGTPAGVGYARKPPRLLQPGDTVEVEVERLGSVRNTVVSNDRRSEWSQHAHGI